MREQLEHIHREALAALEHAPTEADVEQLRVRYLGRKGTLTDIVRGLRDVPPADRPTLGAYLNEIKNDVERRIETSLAALRAAARARQVASERVDVTLPGQTRVPGHLHPITQTIDEVTRIFTGLGFEVADGPDIEDDYHNFTALNLPPDHPARDMQDTFFVGEQYVLRTHTSPVQIRVMESRQPPLRVIVPGAAYRQDGPDITHSPMFHQVEGLVVDKSTHMGHLKGCLIDFCRAYFEIDDLPLRFRASFFPFTEPSAEVDISCQICDGRDPQCRICKGTGWLEVGGAGLIDPNVFEAVGYDPEAVSGFAFGMGVERIAMLKYQINDIRLFFSSDLRFLRQF